MRMINDICPNLSLFSDNNKIPGQSVEYYLARFGAYLKANALPIAGIVLGFVGLVVV